MSTETGFREVYRNADAYEQLLLPHFFDGLTDEEVVADILANQFGSGYHGRLRIAEFGWCRSTGGSPTSAPAPYAAHQYRQARW